MSTEQMKALAVRWFEELWNRRQGPLVDHVFQELAHPNATIRVVGVDGRFGLEEFKLYRVAMLAAISEFSIRVSAVIAEGDRCHVEWQARGVHTGEGLGVPPTGRAVSFSGITALRFADGRIIEGVDAWNRGGLIADLGQLQAEEVRATTRLTAREAQVALMMVERHTHTEIAEALGISVSTSRRHCERVLAKLGIHDRREVAGALARSRTPGGSALSESGEGSGAVYRGSWAP
jgi:DNA-binding CsgD family transcriptional regulator/predicted ester cyclase